MDIPPFSCYYQNRIPFREVHRMTQAPAARNITEGVIWKQLLFFFFPILLGTFFQQMYNTVDTIIVGRFVGTQALAAVGSTGALISLLNGFFVGLSSGATVLVSQFFGAEDLPGIRKALHTGIGLALVLGLIISFLGLCFGPLVLKLMKTPADCLNNAVVYGRIYFSGAVFSMIYNMGAGILRAMGDSRRPMFFLIITCFVNIFLDIFCVVVLKMGVAGAALATVLSQAISAVLVILVLLKLPEDYVLQPSRVRIHPPLLRRILQVGVPAGLQFVTFDLANLLIQSGINSFGSATIAAFTAYAKADMLTWMLSGALGVAITTFVGQNYGARKYDRIHKSVRICLGMGVVLIGASSTVIILFRHVILGVFSTDPEVIRLGAWLMLWVVPFNAFFVPVEVCAGAMRGAGCSALPTAITGICACAFRVLWLFTVVSRFHTLEVLMMCYPISWILADITFLVTYRRGRWLKQPPVEES